MKNCARIFIFGLLGANPCLSFAQTGLPATFDFEEGNSSEWNRACATPSLTWSTSGQHSGSRAARSVLTSGTANDNYCEHVIGSYYSLPAPKEDINEIWAVTWSKFDPGYTWPNNTQKILILNLMDGASSPRCEQIYVFVANNGEYRTDRSNFSDSQGRCVSGASGQFFALSQNRGTPVSVTFGQWDKIKLYVRLNTPGQSDGIVRMWINNVLKTEYTNVPIRQLASHTIQKFLLSTYTTNTGGNGAQWHDDMLISATDPDGDITRPANPQNLHAR